MILNMIAEKDHPYSGDDPCLVLCEYGWVVAKKYGDVWREAQFGEDQLHNVQGYAELATNVYV